MILEAFNKEKKWLHLEDNTFEEDYCQKEEQQVDIPGFSSSAILVSMKGCFIMYGKHVTQEPIMLQSKQDSNIAILSFQLNGSMNVNEKNYDPYRLFENDLHITFFTNKRELIFEAPPVFESFRIILSPGKFDELLAKYHGRFSSYSMMVKQGIYFNMNETPLPITPRMKMIIHDILLHNVVDSLLSKVFFETKITELFGCQLEQIASLKKQAPRTDLSQSDKEKIREAKKLLIQDLADSPTINTISRTVGMNENKLKKGFKELFGTSIYNYLLTHRIEKAVEMIEASNFSIDEIARRVGYADSAHFSRAFRKVKNIPPGQYRKENT